MFLEEDAKFVMAYIYCLDDEEMNTKDAVYAMTTQLKSILEINYGGIELVKTRMHLVSLYGYPAIIADFDDKHGFLQKEANEHLVKAIANRCETNPCHVMLTYKNRPYKMKVGTVSKGFRHKGMECLCCSQ